MQDVGGGRTVVVDRRDGEVEVVPNTRQMPFLGRERRRRRQSLSHFTRLESIFSMRQCFGRTDGYKQ